MNFQIINKTRSIILKEILKNKSLELLAAKILLKIKSDLKKTEKRAHKKLCQAEELSLVFVGTAEMKQLNNQFRKKNKPTDILSFSPVEAHSLGELVFCVSILKQQAKEHNLIFKEEFMYLLIHGVLHLLGYDHELSKSAAKKMYSLQDAIFANLRSKK